MARNTSQQGIAPSPGDHKGRPYYATAAQAGACIVAKERFS